MDSLDRLTKLFEKLPGIGPRQAQRFVQYLLRSSPALRRELAQAIKELGGSVRTCSTCYRFFAGQREVCDICSNTGRDQSTLAVVAADADFEALERSGTFRGRYFVLGGTISLASEKATGLRLAQLLETVSECTEHGLQEVILAFPANPEGDATAERVRSDLVQGVSLDKSFKITSLGRGLSTGSELEYADPETLKSALESRR